MSKDLRNAPVTARVFFEGVILMCVTEPPPAPLSTRHCQLGILPCASHDARITIAVRGAGATMGFSEFYNIDHDIYIQVVKPETPGIALNENFLQHLPDLEGPKLHNSKVEVSTVNFQARLAIDAGELYMGEAVGLSFDLMQWNVNPDGDRLGRWGDLVQDLCLNIVCQEAEGSGIAIWDARGAGRRLKWLPKLDAGSFYEIRIENDCGILGPVGKGSDFRFYYDVIKATDDRKFDFRRPGGATSPDVCEVGYLSKTRTFGLTFQPEGIRVSETRNYSESKTDSET